MLVRPKLRLLATIRILCCSLLCTVAVARAQESKPNWEEAVGLIQAQDYEAAVEVFREFTRLEPENGLAWHFLGYSLHALGKVEDALEIHRKAATFQAVAGTALYNCACACALLDRPEEAFEWLEKARQAGFTNWRLLYTDPDLNSIRDDPRFAAFLPQQPNYSQPWKEPHRILQSWGGERPYGQFGWEVANLGDVDGDGIADAACSAPYYPIDGIPTGRVYVFSGSTGRRLWAKGGGKGSFFGFALAGAGDCNGDEVPDVLIGAPSANHLRGVCVVLSGVDGRELRRLRGERSGDQFGAEVWGPGDWNRDGYDDLWISAPNHDGVGADSGRCYLYSGKDGSLLFVLDGESAGDHFGSALAGVVTADEKLLAVGAMDSGEERRGRVYLYRGTQAVDDEALPVLERRIEADETAVNYGRYFLSFPGDVNRDGRMDLYSVDFENRAQGPNSGRAYVHSGKDGQLLHVFDGRAGEGLGIGNGYAGDLDDDGHADLLVGAWLNHDFANMAGCVYVFSGRTGERLQSWTGLIAGDSFGFDATGIGDINDDDVPDFLLSAPLSRDRGPRTGRVYVLAGRRPAE